MQKVEKQKLAVVHCVLVHLTFNLLFFLAGKIAAALISPTRKHNYKQLKYTDLTTMQIHKVLKSTDFTNTQIHKVLKFTVFTNKQIHKVLKYTDLTYPQIHKEHKYRDIIETKNSNTEISSKKHLSNSQHL